MTSSGSVNGPYQYAATDQMQYTTYQQSVDMAGLNQAVAVGAQFAAAEAVRKQMEKQVESPKAPFEGLRPDESQFVLQLLQYAKQYGITELHYRDLKIRLSHRAQQDGAGPVQISKQAQHANGDNWATSFKFPSEA